MFSRVPNTTFLKKPELTFEEIKKFLVMNISNQNVCLDPGLKIGLKKFIVQYVNSFIRSNDNNSEVYSLNLLPQSWTDREIIKHAYHLMQYQGLQLIFKSEKNCDPFENNYIEFMQEYKISIQDSIKSGNLLIAYLHVVKLFREINKLNKQLIGSTPPTKAPSQTLFNMPMGVGSTKKIPTYKILEHLKIGEEELLTTITNLNTVLDTENQFWTNALIALGLHTMASIHYNASNQETYNLNQAEQLLHLAKQACDEGISALAQLNDLSFVRFYTLQYSLMPTLPYQSFEDEKKAILECITGLGRP